MLDPKILQTENSGSGKFTTLFDYSSFEYALDILKIRNSQKKKLKLPNPDPESCRILSRPCTFLHEHYEFLSTMILLIVFLLSSKDLFLTE